MRAPRTRGWRRLHLTFHLLFYRRYVGLAAAGCLDDRRGYETGAARASALRCAIGSICSCGNWILPMATWCWQILSSLEARELRPLQARRARASLPCSAAR